MQEKFHGGYIMKNNNIIRIRRIYDILLSISIIVAGICLIAGSLTIYFTGEQTYSREIVADTFSSIAIPVYICLALTIISFIWELVLPSPVQKQKPRKAYAFILERLLEKRDLSQCSEEFLYSMDKERKIRKLHTIIRTVLLCISSIAFLSYALNGNNFHQSEINTSMIHAMWILIPCMAVPFGYAVFTVYHNDKSLKREIELLKQVPVSSTAKTTKEVSVCHSEKKENTLRYALLFVGITIMVYGFISGGTADVLTKAINICTECIGLG